MDREAFEAHLLYVDASQLLGRLEHEGVIADLFPEVQAMVGFGGKGTQHKDLWWHTRLVVEQCIPNALVRWAALFHDVGKPPTFQLQDGKVTFHNHEAVSAKLWSQAARRVDWFSNEERRTVKALIYQLGRVESYYVGWSDSAIRRLSKEIGDLWPLLMELAKADSTTKYDSKRSKHHQRMQSLMQRRDELEAQDAIVPALPSGLGHELMKLGLRGPELGATMTRLRQAVEDGKLPRQADPAVYMAWVRGDK
jgi:poly(A) polymerase